MKILNNFIVTAVLSVSSLSAHTLWVNSFESFTYNPPHISVSLGWGHNTPIDDMLNSINGKVVVEDFTITSPSSKVTKLRIPSSSFQEPNETTTNFDLYDSDIALQKIAFKEKSEKGVYLIEAKSQATVLTQYFDLKNRKRLKLKTMDKIKDVKEILKSVKSQNIARTYLALGKWKKQKPTNKGLEIIPKTDLSKVKVGDLVELEVLFYGKALNMTANNMEYIKASSKNFGQKENFSLMSYIIDGKAQIRVQSKGQWIISCNHKEVVTKDGKLKALYKKVNSINDTATITFNVK